MDDDDRYMLSSEMMEETLKYFTLCGDRVVQMTKTYNDIDAVTKLLEEKEKDLELAAKIGQSLLQQNKNLEGRIEVIEEQLTVINDQNTQLRHDMKLKEELLRIYTNDLGQSDSEDEASWNDKSKLCYQTKYVNVDTLQKKIKNLEEENLHLRIETAELRTNTTSIEEKEEQLVRDCFKQLGDARCREEILTEELSKKFEDNMRQQEEITYLLAQVVDLQQKVKKLSVENEEMNQHLHASKDAQQQLTQELQEMKEKYDEVYTMLQEAQETAKKSNRHSIPHGGIGFGTYLNPLPVFPADSLAAELVDSVEQKLGNDPHLTRKGKREYNKNVMNTVKAVNKRSHNSPASGYSSDFYSRQTSPSSSVISLVGSPRSEMYEGDSESANSPTGSGQNLKVSGIPGSNDLETALRRLKLRRQNEIAEREYADRHADSPGTDTPTCYTPDSLFSGLSGMSGISGVPPTGQTFRGYMPEKLQIVKPMEGSMALHHWQRLATPHIASMLDSRPGVVVKGFREIEMKRDSFNLDDIEDDGCVMRSTIPSKCFVNTSSTYTYTTSRMGQAGNTMMTSTNPSGTRMTIDLQSTGSSSPGVYDPPPGASLGLASVLAEPQVTSGSAVRLKTSAVAGGQKSKRSSVGLNMISTSPNSEKRTELDTNAPSGVHKVSGGIFSRNTSPASAMSSGIKILDHETKMKLMEKVRNIRAEKASSTHTSVTTTNAVMLAPSMAVVPSMHKPQFGLPTLGTGGFLPSFSATVTPPTSTYSSSSSTPYHSNLGGMTMSSSTFSAGGISSNLGGMNMSSSAYSGGGISSNLGGMNMSSSAYSGGGISSNLGGMNMSSSAYSGGGITSNLGGMTMSSSTLSAGGITSTVKPISSVPTPSLGGGMNTHSSGGIADVLSAAPCVGTMSTPRLPVIGQSRLAVSPMSMLASSCQGTLTTTSTETTTAGLGQALDYDAKGLGQVLDLAGSPPSVIAKNKSRSVHT